MVKTFPVPLNKEEIDKIVDASMEDDFYYMLFTVAKSTGRRLGEYWNVRVKDINFDTNIMLTQVLKRRKFIEKEAILTPFASVLIKKHVMSLKLGPEDYVFRTQCSYRQIQNKVKHYTKKAGITKNVSFHNFRHYFITELVRQGWSYEKIAKLTGHSTPQTLIAYDHAVASDIKKDALEALKSI